MDIIIRNSKSEDFNDIFLLFKQLWPNKELNINDLNVVFNRGIQSHIDKYISAEINGNIIGLLVAIVNNFWQEGYIAYVYAMIVDESYRSSGIGSSLLEKAFDIAKLSGCKKINWILDFHVRKLTSFMSE